jgi:cyclohexyl-isocyanide hydratase
MVIGMFIFPDMTQLDFTGPYEVLTKLPGVKVKVVAPSAGPVAVDGGLRILPDTTVDNAPSFDVVFVPGGPGVGAVMEDRDLLGFVHEQGLRARYVTSVCTGALILGAAGLLKGYRATTHWLSLDLLPFFGATPVPDRVVIDRNRITGGGVTAGIDFALSLAAEISGPETAQMIQLIMEYNPTPPFASGHPSVADARLVEEVRKTREVLQRKRAEQAKRVAGWYCG